MGQGRLVRVYCMSLLLLVLKTAFICCMSSSLTHLGRRMCLPLVTNSSAINGTVPYAIAMTTTGWSPRSEPLCYSFLCFYARRHGLLLHFSQVLKPLSFTVMIFRSSSLFKGLYAALVEKYCQLAIATSGKVFSKHSISKFFIRLFCVRHLQPPVKNNA